MSDIEKISLSLGASLIIFSLGILYKTFEIKYSKLLEIEENERFCKSWIKIIFDNFYNYKEVIKQYTDYIKNYQNVETNIPIFDFQEDKILKINTDKLFNYYITNRNKSNNELDFYLFIKSLGLITYHNSILEKMFIESKKYNEEYAISLNNLIHEFEDERLKLTESNYIEFRNEYLNITTIKKKSTELLRNEVYELFLKEYNKNPTDQKILILLNKISKIKSKIGIQENSRIRYSEVLKNIINDMEESIISLNSSFNSLTQNKINFLLKIK